MQAKLQTHGVPTGSKFTYGADIQEASRKERQSVAVLHQLHSWLCGGDDVGEGEDFPLERGGWLLTKMKGGGWTCHKAAFIQVCQLRASTYGPA